MPINIQRTAMSWARHLEPSARRQEAFSQKYHSARDDYQRGVSRIQNDVTRCAKHVNKTVKAGARSAVKRTTDWTCETANTLGLFVGLGYKEATRRVANVGEALQARMQPAATRVKEWANATVEYVGVIVGLYSGIVAALLLKPEAASAQAPSEDRAASGDAQGTSQSVRRAHAESSLGDDVKKMQVPCAPEREPCASAEHTLASHYIDVSDDLEDVADAS